MSTRKMLGSGMLVAAAMVASLGAAGCTPPKSAVMSPAPRNTVEAPADAATVIFVRPSFYAAAVKVLVVDEKGRFLGESIAESYFPVKVPAGEHKFYAVTDTVAPMKATLQNGHVYYVQVHANEGAFSPRFQLYAVTPRSKHWGHVDEWLAKTESLAPDEAAGQARLAEHGGVDRAVQKGDQVLAEYDANELAERTIAPEEGKATTSSAAPAAPSPAPAPAAEEAK